MHPSARRPAPITLLPERALRALFVLAALATLVLSLWPFEDGPPLHTGWDKADHLIGFLLLGVVGQGGWPARRWAVLAGLVVFGLSIEGLQGLSGYRQADVRDLVANGLGLALAAGLWQWWRR